MAFCCAVVRLAPMRVRRRSRNETRSRSLRCAGHRIRRCDTDVFIDQLRGAASAVFGTQAIAHLPRSLAYLKIVDRFRDRLRKVLDRKPAPERRTWTAA